MESCQNSVQKLSLNVEKLIHPDLLTVEELVTILRERSVDENLLSQSKDQLVALFKRVALPLPQREHRNNYRGNLLTKLREERESKNVTPDDGQKSYTVGVSESVPSTKPNVKGKYDRLKPPPDVNSSEIKKIRLSTSSKTTEISRLNSSSDLDDVVIKKHKSQSSDSNIEKNNDLNNFNLETDRLSNISEVKNDEKCNGSKNNAPKKILLKRNYLPSPAVSSPESSTEKAPSEPDKKRKPITWP